MGYLVKGRSFTSYYEIKFRKASFKPFAIYFPDAKDENTAMEMARDEIETLRCQTALITSCEKYRNSPGEWHPYGSIDYDKPWYQQRIIAWDVETTGLSAKDNRITEFGCSTYNPETKQFEKPQSFFINDGQKVSAKVTELTGITQEMIDDAPPFAEVWFDHIEPIFANADLAFAQNRGFDIGFMRNSLSRNNIEGSIPQTVCTMELALRSNLGTPNHRLGTLGEHLGVEGANTHRAGDDGQLCGNVGLALCRLNRYFHSANTREFLDYFDKYSWVE